MRRKSEAQSPVVDCRQTTWYKWFNPTDALLDANRERNCQFHELNFWRGSQNSVILCKHELWLMLTLCAWVELSFGYSKGSFINSVFGSYIGLFLSKTLNVGSVVCILMFSCLLFIDLWVLSILGKACRDRLTREVVNLVMFLKIGIFLFIVCLPG